MKTDGEETAQKRREGPAAVFVHNPNSSASAGEIARALLSDFLRAAAAKRDENE